MKITPRACVSWRRPSASTAAPIGVVGSVASLMLKPVCARAARRLERARTPASCELVEKRKHDAGLSLQEVGVDGDNEHVVRDPAFVAVEDSKVNADVARALPRFVDPAAPHGHLVSVGRMFVEIAQPLGHVVERGAGCGHDFVPAVRFVARADDAERGAFAGGERVVPIAHGEHGAAAVQRKVDGTRRRRSGLVGAPGERQRRRSR